MLLKLHRTDRPETLYQRGSEPTRGRRALCDGPTEQGLGLLGQAPAAAPSTLLKAPLEVLANVSN